MPERKRLTLAGALILKQVARALDDVTDMFIRQVNKMHHKAEEALMQFRQIVCDRCHREILGSRSISTFALLPRVMARGAAAFAGLAGLGMNLFSMSF
jgi:hypothetical protein